MFDRLLPALCTTVVVAALAAPPADAAPLFARKYNLSCAACHSAFPALNAFGEQFADNGFRLPNWKDSTLQTGDDQLALPDSVPAAFRAQAYVQARDDAEAVDVVTGERTEAGTDFQAPYLIKLISSAPLSDHITYYFYAIFAEKGGNGEVIVEDAWFSYDDLFGSEVSMMLGQFQVSDLMFPREIRLTFQDFMAYRMAGITYERGVLFERGFGPVDVGVGLVNGNGIEDNVTVNSPGFRRPDHLFDNDDKAVFTRLATSAAGLDGGVFLYAGEQPNAVGPAGTDDGDRDTDKEIAGLDLSGHITPQARWFAQLLWNRWDGFLQPGTEYDWFGGFVGADYVPGGRWSYSVLYNYADADDLDDTDTVYEGIDINSLTFNASYYFMRNVKGVIELNVDLQDKESRSGTFFTGHLSREHYILVGFDAAF